MSASSSGARHGTRKQITERVNGKKSPINPRTGKAGSNIDPTMWCSFGEAIAAVDRWECDGIGFALGEAEDGVNISGIDLDNCRDIETGELSSMAREIIAMLDTYWEVSPSGTGIKGLCFDKLPLDARTKNKAGTVETYCDKRFFVLTGCQVDGTSADVESRQEQLTAVYAKYIGSEQKKESSDAPPIDPNDPVCDAALAAMFLITPGDDESDGSRRLFTVCCRAVEYDLSDDAAIAAIRRYEERHPFPADYSDGEILTRVRAAEQKVERGSAIIIANFEMINVQGKDGKWESIRIPRSMGDIIEDIYRRTGFWPRRVDGMLFVDDPVHGIDYFDRRTTAGLIGWLRRRSTVKWVEGGDLVGKGELFAEIERSTQRYDGVELLPHEPPFANIYYRGNAPQPGDGTYLRRLLDRFRPETTIDRDLIQAALMTALWGGPAGCRPVFVVTALEGRGVGKTALVDKVGQLYGGVIDVSAGEKIQDLKTRLLSPAARTKCIALLDNMKTMRLSWAELEALVTSPAISGKQLYVGEGQRPNLLTWFITLNGVSLATDMAQRSVVIRLVSGENAGSWYEDTTQFIEKYRDQLIGDIIGALRKDRTGLAKYSRWAAWEKDVLCRLPNPADAQRLILERQGEANCEIEEAEIVEEYFADRLKSYEYNPNTAQVRIPVATVAEWYCLAVGEKTKTDVASKKIRQLVAEGQMKRIAPDRSHSHGRCFIWTGADADVFHNPIQNDLRECMEASSQSRSYGH